MIRSRAFVSTLSVAVFLAAWEIAPRLHLVEGFYTSQPSHVLAASAEIVRSGSFLRDAFATNTVLMTVGFILVGYQVAGYFTAA